MAKSINIAVITTLDAKGLKAAEQQIAGLSKAQAQAAQATAKMASANATVAASAAKAAQANDKIAISASKVATQTAQQEAAQNRAAISAIRLASAQEKASKPPSGGLNAYFDKLKGDITGAAAAMVGYGAAVKGVTAVAQSFADAFNFKNELDATTASINIQLKGVRDSGQVWNEAAAYAQKYKLTQAETTSTVQASIGILRNSQASVEDTFSVLQRMTLLAPGKTIQDAAFSVRELASGDIVSIADQFNISKQKAYEMRDAIVAGGDTVALLGQYLDQSGISMDALKVKTEGALGAQKDLAIAAEQLQLAQAEFAAGPGMTILETQIKVVTGATRLLSGDWNAMSESIAAGTEASNARMAASYGATDASIQIAKQQTIDFAAAQAASFGASDQHTAALQANANAAAIDAVEIQRLSNATGIHAPIQQQAAQATTQLDAATLGVAKSLSDETVKKQESADKATLLASMQQRIAELAGPVSQGIISNAGAAGLLANEYGIATAAAQLLIAEQARLAGNNARIAAQAGNVKDLTNGGIGFNAPGRTGKSNADILATVAAAQKDNAKAADDTAAAQRRLNEVTGGSSVVLANMRKDLNSLVPGSAAYIDKLADIAQAEASAAKAGGARTSAAEKTTNKLVAIEQSAADKIIEINRRLVEEQAASARNLASDIATTTADMIADQEANDLDLIGAKEENMGRLAAREEAEANARIAQAAAVSEAQARAAAGDAETASAVLDLREQSIAKQQQLDEDYANKRAELAGNPEELAALKQQYDEATQAAKEATDVRIGLAEAEAEQRKQKVEEEKVQAISAAAEAASALAATGKNANTAAGQVDAMIARLAAIPTSVTTTINVKTTGSGESGSASSSGGGGASVKSAGGGTFVTNGRTHFTVGDNPGGRELVSVTPIGAAGRTSVRGNVARLAGGGSVDVNGSASDAKRRLDEANARAKNLAMPRTGATGGSTKRAAEKAAKEEKAAKPAIADYSKAAKENLDLLGETLKLRTIVQDPATWRPINDAVLASAAADADKVARTFATIASTYDTKVLEGAKLYTDALKGTYDVIKDGLETTDRLRGSDLSIPTSALQNFQANAMAVIDTVGQIGAKAATIPEASVSALGNIASTLAVLPSLGMLGGGFGGGGDTNNNNMGGNIINIYQQPGQSAQELMRLINSQLGMRR